MPLPAATSAAVTLISAATSSESILKFATAKSFGTDNVIYSAKAGFFFTLAVVLFLNSINVVSITQSILFYHLLSELGLAQQSWAVTQSQIKY